MKNIFNLILASLLFVGCDIAFAQVIEGTSARQVEARKNYIKDGDAEAYARGWTTYADAVAARPVDGTGGSPTVGAVGITNTNPIEDKRSFLISKAASNVQGQGYSYPFTISRGDRAKVLDIKIKYELVSGTFVAGSQTTDSDLIVYVFDITNSKLIEPSSIKFLSNSTNGDEFSASFQSSVDSVSYRLIIHHATTSSSAFVFKGEYAIYPSRYVYGTPVTDWALFTPTGTATTNTTYSGRWRRVGSNMEVETRLDFTGAPNAFAVLDVNIPPGYSIDTANTENTAISYSGSIFDNGVNRYPMQTYILSATSVRPHVVTSSGAFTTISGISNTSPFTIGNTDHVDFGYSVPIVGWASSTQMSDSADTRVVAARVDSVGNQSIPSATWTKVTNLSTVLTDTHGHWDSVNDRLIVRVPGIYKIIVSGAYTNNGTGARAVSVTYNGGTIPSETGHGATGSSGDIIAQSGSFIKEFKAGEYLEAAAYQSSGGSLNLVNSVLQLERISGPSAISATELIAARYKTSAGQSFTNNTETTVVFGTKDIDTHNAFNPATGFFTAPAAGIYRIDATTTFVANATGTRVSYSKLNTSTYISTMYIYEGVSAVRRAIGNTTIVRLNAGDTVSITAIQTSGGSLALQANQEDNHVSIQRVGL